MSQRSNRTLVMRLSMKYEVVLGDGIVANCLADFSAWTGDFSVIR